MQRPNGRSWRAFVLGLIVSAVSIFILARRVDGQALLRALATASVAILSLCLLTRAMAFVCMAMRSRILYERFGSWPLSLFLRAHVIGFGGNVVLPFRLGELLRVRELARGSGVSMAACLGATVVERALDVLWLLVLVVTLPLLVALDLHLTTTLWLTFAAIAVALGVSAWLGNRPQSLLPLVRRIGGWAGPRAQAWLEDAAEGLIHGLSVIGSPARFVLGSLWTLAYWASSALGVAIWLWAFDLHLPWYAAPTVVAFLALGASLPAAPGFIGTYDLFAVSGLALFGVGATQATAVAITGHFVSTVPGTLVALALFMRRRDTASA
jgi:uncharacterized protein (TIRG00374 family)